MRVQITAISTIVVNADLRNWIFVRVETDVPGLYGWGEATLEWKTRAVVGAVEDLAPLLIGADPRDIAAAVRLMHKGSFWRMGVIGSSAISGIEIALWDILGKSLCVPVWRLLGGKVRDRVRCYTHLGMGAKEAVYGAIDASKIADHARAIVDAGYTALKIVCVPYTHMTASAADLRTTATVTQTLRAAVGPDVDIMLDFHGRPGSVTASLAHIAVASEIAPLFVEEPLPPEDVEGLAMLAVRTTVPIATGERLIGRHAFEPLLTRRLIAIAQPDICHTGGLLETMKIAAQAETCGIGMAPHNPLGPIAGAAALHFAVSSPNFVIQEEMAGAVPWFDEVVEGPIVRDGGWWRVPERPGLGVEVNLAAAARHPFIQEPMLAAGGRDADGLLLDW
jgi:galactonate dehydratase